MNSCLFTIFDLKLFISSIESKGYIINQGPQKNRGQVSCLSNQINCIDNEFRKALSNHNNYHSMDYRALPKDRFSFRNIHMNLGGVRWYSTTRVNNELRNKKTSSVKKDRQGLFQNNYNIILEMLNNNYNIGSEELQIKLEKLLQQQENLYAENNLSDLKLKFNEASYDMIVKK